MTCLTSFASDVTIPNTFAAQQPAIAVEVNDNFTAVETAVNDNDSRLAALEIIVSQLQSDLATANATIAQHESRISDLEGNSVLDLDGYLTLTSINGYGTAEFSGVNVQINNGTGTTDGSGRLSGLGNLTIGYNETTANAPFFCSDPDYDNEIDCIINMGTWANNVRNGSHNLILGMHNSYGDFAGIVAGSRNIINNSYSSVLSGRNNQASGKYSTISGGWENSATGEYSSVSGGTGNTASAFVSSISGGAFNTASENSSTVCGGSSNTASGAYSSVSGGQNGTAAGAFDWVAGTLFEDH